MVRKLRDRALEAPLPQRTAESIKENMPPMSKGTGIQRPLRLVSSRWATTFRLGTRCREVAEKQTYQFVNALHGGSAARVRGRPLREASLSVLLSIRRAYEQMRGLRPVE